MWVPYGKKLDWGWRAFARGDELTDLLNGARYARNLVHHHWADALRRDQGFRFPIRYPMVYYSWVWRDADELPKHPGGDNEHVMRNREAYAERLAAVRAEDTLLALGDAFGRVGTFSTRLVLPRRKRRDLGRVRRAIARVEEVGQLGFGAREQVPVSVHRADLLVPEPELDL